MRCSWTMERWFANWRWNRTHAHITTMNETIWSLKLRHIQFCLLSRESIISNSRVFCERCGHGASQFLQTAHMSEAHNKGDLGKFQNNVFQAETTESWDYWRPRVLGEKKFNRLLSSFCAMWGQIDILQWTLIDPQLGEKQQLPLIIE